MSLLSQDQVFLCALKKHPAQRTPQDVDLIYSHLHRYEALGNLREQRIRSLSAQVRYEWHNANEILYGKDDPCTCWFILLSGSIFIQGSMFLRNTSFGKRIPGMKRRGTQCLVLEPSEMIVIDYQDDPYTWLPEKHTNDNLNQSVSIKSIPSSIDDGSQSLEASPGRISRSRRMKFSHDQASSVNSESQSIASRESWDSSQGSEFVSQENLKVDDMEGEEDIDDAEEQEDSISLHSSSSVIKDLVIDALKKDLTERNEDDHDALFEFTRGLQAFSNMTELTRKKLCHVMIFAQVDRADSIVLNDNEALDTWSVIINGSVKVVYPDSGDVKILGMGESFGVEPNMQAQHHKGIMYAMVDECQFVCITQQHYFEVLSQEKENMDYVLGEDGSLEMVKEKREVEGGRKGHIVIRGVPSSLYAHLLEENSIDTTYAEDFLLTYRAFWNEPRKICQQLLQWFERDQYKGKITRVILLWVNNHFNDFEEDSYMMELLEKFEEKLRQSNKSGECRLFNIACSTKAKSRVIKFSRSSNEDLGIILDGGSNGYPIYISKVSPNSKAVEKGVKRGDQLLNVNGQNFEKLELEKANAILKKNTDLTLTVKTNLFAFKAMVSDQKNPSLFKQPKSKEVVPLIPQSATLQTQKISRFSSFASETDIYDGKTGKKDYPEDVIKIFKADQTFRFIFVNPDTTAEEAVSSACKEFGIPPENFKTYSLCRVTVQNETFVKQSKLPDKWSNLSEIPLSARYYLKNDLESEQLLPDENIPDILKEANYSFLDLDCFEVALQLTIQDYELFRTVEQTDFIDDLFKLNENGLENFKSFENLVNRELFWVVSTLCNEPNVLRRSKMIKHFTKIAHHCKSLKNLNSTFAIISGLGYRAVSRMRSSWEKVPMKIQRTFEDLQSLMDPSRNMSKYRTLLSDFAPQPPVIPYIPVIKKDLTFLHLGNDTKVDGLVNFEKMRMMGREIRNVCRLCSAESSQIFSSAMAPNSDGERSNIYQTLTRKNRRSSFSNARKMYEDAVTTRRVKQYMLHLTIETDEDKLMEMSKQVEPVSVASAHVKRKNEKTDSPSRTSKTLPHGATLPPSFAKGNSQGRNNSEPHIYAPSGMLAQVTRKKTPASSLPKFGTSSPHAIKKLLSLSEESDSSTYSSSKQGSKDSRGESLSSQDLSSPHSSPSLQSRHEILVSKGSMSSSDSSHSLAHENNNHNNNKGHGRTDCERAGCNTSSNSSHPTRPCHHVKSSTSPKFARGGHRSKSDAQAVQGLPRKTAARNMGGKPNIRGSKESLNSAHSLEDRVDGSKKSSKNSKRDSSTDLSRSGKYPSSSSLDSTQNSQGNEARNEEVKQAFLYGSRGTRDTPLATQKYPSQDAIPSNENLSLYYSPRSKTKLYDINQSTEQQQHHQNKKKTAYQDVHGYYEQVKSHWQPYLRTPVEYFPAQNMPVGDVPVHSPESQHFRSRSADVLDQHGNYQYFRKSSSYSLQEGNFEVNPNLYYPESGYQGMAPPQYIYPPKVKDHGSLDSLSESKRMQIYYQSSRKNQEDMADMKPNRSSSDSQRLAMANRMKKEALYPSEYADPDPRTYLRANQLTAKQYLSPVPAYASSRSVPQTPSAMADVSMFPEHNLPQCESFPNLSDHHRNFIPSPISNTHYVTKPQFLPLHQPNTSAMRQYAIYENERLKIPSQSQSTPTRDHSAPSTPVEGRYNYPIDAQMPMTQNVFSPPSYYGEVTSPVKSSPRHAPRPTPRRKSQEWSVTDLDKENQQSAMQVWTTRPNATSNHSQYYHRNSKDNGSLQQLNEEYKESINQRISSISLTASPPTSSEIDLNNKDVHNGMNEVKESQNASFEGPNEKKRIPPSYNEALGHVAVNSSFLPTNSELPSYEDLEVLKDGRELSSKV